MGVDAVAEFVCDRCKRKTYSSLSADWTGESVKIPIIGSGRDFYAKIPNGWKRAYGLVLCPECAKEFEKFMKGGE